MKKALLVLGLSVFFISKLFAGDTEKARFELRTNYQYGESDTTRTFALLNANADECIIGLKTSIKGAGTEHKTGLITWDNITIENVGSDLTIKLKDGIMQRDKTGSTVSFAVF